jgi:two-component system sensor histidine kinase ChiS
VLFSGKEKTPFMSRSHKCILVVDDEPDTADLFAEMMQLNGYRVLKSNEGTQAMRLVAREKPDLVVLDVMMPDVSGLEVLRFMRRDPRLEQIPVLVVSAKITPDEIQAGLKAGANLYLTKPVSYGELRRAVEEATGDAN